MKAVLSALEQHHLYAKAFKCQFGIAGLDHTVSGAGIKVDTLKVKAILVAQGAKLCAQVLHGCCICWS